MIMPARKSSFSFKYNTLFSPQRKKIPYQTCIRQRALDCLIFGTRFIVIISIHLPTRYNINIKKMFAKLKYHTSEIRQIETKSFFDLKFKILPFFVIG